MKLLSFKTPLSKNAFLDFENVSFKPLSATCDEFKVTGVLAYDSKKSSIYITDITYCGEDDKTVYYFIW